ncbi:hypothetical protein EJD97_009883, partial [Solanum chilense]
LIPTPFTRLSLFPSSLLPSPLFPLLLLRMDHRQAAAPMTPLSPSHLPLLLFLRPLSLSPSSLFFPLSLPISYPQRTPARINSQPSVSMRQQQQPQLRQNPKRRAAPSNDIKPATRLEGDRNNTNCSS